MNQNKIQEDILLKTIELLKGYEPTLIDEINDLENQELKFTQKYLLPKIKEEFKTLINEGLVVKGPGDVAIPSFYFLNAKSITDIVFLKDSKRLLSVEIKLLRSEGKRNQNLSTAIGQGIIQSLSKFENSIIYILDFNKNVPNSDVDSLRNLLSNIDVHLVYTTV